MSLKPNIVNSKLPDTCNYKALGSINDAFLELDADWQVVYASPGAESVVAPFINTDLPQTKRWEPVIKWLNEPLRKAQTTHQNTECECYETTSGRIWQLRIYQVVARTTVYIRDITAHKQTQIFSEQRIRSLFDHNPDAVYTLHLDGHYNTVNASSEWISGYTSDELRGLDFGKLVLERDYERTRNHFMLAAQGEVQCYPVTIRRKDGGLRNLHVTNFPIVQDGVITGVFGIAKDMTIQHMTEALLRKSIELLADSQKTAHVGSWELDTNLRRIYFSNEIFHIFGIDVTSGGYVDFETFFACVHPADKERVSSAILERTTIGSGIVEMEFRIYRPGGEERTIQVIGQCNGQSHLRMRGSLQDITVLRRIERQLSESEQRYRSIVNHHPDGVCALDLEGTLIDANPAFEHITGYRVDELKGMTYDQLMPPDEASRIHNEVVCSGNGDKLDRINTRVLQKNGTQVQITNTVVPIIVNGERVGTYCIIKDISEQLVTDELYRKSDKLKVVGQLAAAVAHEIRNPLTALKGFIKLIHTNGIAMNPQYFNIIQDELSRIELISSELLMLAKPQAGRVQAFDLQQVLEQTIVLLSTQAVMNNIEIVQEFRAESTNVLGDPTQLKQIFVNLLKNAIEAMQAGGTIIVALDMIDHHIRVRIQDEGCGMPEEMVQRLGEPFYTTKEKGTGLGFMVTKRIVEAHQGWMQVSSIKDQGTTVDVYFPSHEV